MKGRCSAWSALCPQGGDSAGRWKIPRAADFYFQKGREYFGECPSQNKMVKSFD